jgi:NAD(P)-dependent dehydrogenase (short-subunit alcohol dehydrogenase family)
MRHSGKTAVVTGGVSGLGAACVRRLLAEGARVAVFDIREPSDTFLQSLGDTVSNVRFLPTDVTRTEELAGSVDRVLGDFGSIDILHANAGRLVAGDGLVHETPVEAWDALFELNVFAAMATIRAVLPTMLAARRGVVLISSSIGARGGAVPAYASSKAALLGLMRGIARAHREDGIRCVAIAPGSHDTPIREHNDVPNDRGALVETVIGMRRLGDPDEVASLVSFLASDDAAGLSGHAFAVDGGFHA